MLEQNLFQEKKYLQICEKDPTLMSVVDAYGLPDIKKRQPNFEAFVRIIVNQQLSDAAASTILGRLKGIFENGLISATQIICMPENKMRDIGISFAKISYIKGIADIFCTNSNFLVELQKMSDEELIGSLSKIRGFGKWSCSIFALFYLGRENIFVHGDVSINKALRSLYDLENQDIREFIDAKTSQWSPLNSLTCLLLWHYIDSSKINNRG